MMIQSIAQSRNGNAPDWRIIPARGHYPGVAMLVIEGLGRVTRAAQRWHPHFLS